MTIINIILGITFVLIIAAGYWGYKEGMKAEQKEDRE